MGCDHDTARVRGGHFAALVEQADRAAYPDADRLLVTADAGGSNG